MVKRVIRRLSKPLAKATAAVCMLAIVAGFGLAYLLLSATQSATKGLRVEFKAIQASYGKHERLIALEALKGGSRSVIELQTNRVERPFWVLSQPVPGRLHESRAFFLPSRHAQRLSAWILDQSGEVVAYGSAERGEAPTGVRQSRAGFTIEIPASASAASLLVRVESSGPARLSVEHWDTAELELASRQFDQAGGVLFGSLLMIAAFGALISILARDFTFFVFAAWVVASLRFASYSGGWDLAWLGLSTAEDYPTLVKNVPLAAYALLMVALFRGIFRKDVAKLRASNTIRLLMLVSGALLLVAVALPHRLFLPVLWAVAIPSLVVLMWLTIRIFAKTGSTAAIWYGASWLVTLGGSASEVAFASGVLSGKPLLLNSLTGAIFSALLAGIALAERIKSERAGRVQAQARTFSVLERFRENYNSMPVGLFSLDSTGLVTLHNPSFRAMFGINVEQDAAPSVYINDLIGPDSLDRLRAAAAVPSGPDIELHLPGVGTSGRWFLARVTSKGSSIEGSIQDISTRKAAEGQLRHLVDHDHLTGLLNRRGLEATIARAIDQAALGLPCALAYIDLDRFKLINDLHGHGTGDALLQQSAARLRTAVRNRDSIARIADSFVVVFFDCPDHAVAGLTERIREAIGEGPFDIDGKGLNMTASVGVVTIDRSMSFVDAMAAADRACSEAKARGRNCVVRLTEQDSALRTHLEELKVVADLQQRVPTERYFLEFQPIVALQAAMSSLNYEVLIRMRGENNTVIPPGKFIGAAERNGLMSQIDRWVLRSTLEWLDDHPEHRDRLAFATINISGASLNDTRFVSDAFSMIAEHPLAMTKLCFEITESVALHDLGSTRRFVDGVRAYGSKLALDDFGAGYTSFNYLKEIPADFIKIDGSFVKDINRNPANYAITRTIVELTHELGMRSIAEWAETPDTIASLIELGVDYGQGFGLVRPISPDIVTAALSGGSLVKDPEVITLLADYSAVERIPRVRRVRQRKAS
jgi:diguanylate cyclase (GGDEF)-like protein